MQTSTKIIGGEASEIEISSIVPCSFFDRYSRWWMTSLLMFSDAGMLALAFLLALNVRMVMGSGIELDKYIRMLPLIVVFLIVYAWRGLYPAVGLSPVEELQRISVTTSIVFLLIATITALTHSVEEYSRWVFGFTWLFSQLFVQLGRWLVRIVAIRFHLWGEPVAIIGYGIRSQSIIEFLRQHSRLGLKPEVIIDSSGTVVESSLPITILKYESQNDESLRQRLQRLGISTAILIQNEIPALLQDLIVERSTLGIKRIILIPDLDVFGSAGILSRDMEGILGLEVHFHLLDPIQQTIKRLMDIILVILGGIILLPLFVFISLLIRLDSPGSIFYTQIRIGRGGREFKMWKFRTMCMKAESILKEYLDKYPSLRDEWDKTQKIKDDPRLTRVGRLLRRYSLDEFPQIINVLKGDMSLVGPRPFFRDQLELYGRTYDLYKLVRPGLTGMWQVSGRNLTTFAERVYWDEYYVRQWSIWLDIYLLLRTILIVIRGSGAF